MSFFENTRKPVGLGGKLMVAMMNLGHTPVATWGLEFLHLSPDAKVLDCGCGGGANMKRLLKKCPQGIVKGIDYSPVSVEKARSLNRAAIQEGRCVVWQGSVEHIIFAKEWRCLHRFIRCWINCLLCGISRISSLFWKKCKEAARCHFLKTPASL